MSRAYALAFLVLAASTLRGLSAHVTLRTTSTADRGTQLAPTALAGRDPGRPRTVADCAGS